MAMPQYSLLWESHKTSFCNGFSALQQSGEFVDLTLAADGHFVKVHQMLIALASPYLKELITSTQCKHPVIFLNNVSHRILTLMLEYIYTGEVLVPAESLGAFSEAARNLHIKGLESLHGEETDFKTATYTYPDSNVGSYNPTTTQPSSNQMQYELPPNAKKVLIKHENNEPESTHLPSLGMESGMEGHDDDMHDYSEILNETHDDYSLSADVPIKRTIATNVGKTKDKDQTINMQFTISNRGSLQIILNRFIYNLHSTQRGGQRRWRCVDYRNDKCAAFVVTKGNVVISRAHPHNHAFHDKKILAKIDKKVVFSALNEVEDFQKKNEGGFASQLADASAEDTFLNLRGEEIN